MFNNFSVLFFSSWSANINICGWDYCASIGNQKKHPLTPFFKWIAYRKGRNAAITATARKLAVIIRNMVTKTQPYRQPNVELLLEKRKYAQVKNIKSRLFKLNLTDEEMMDLFQKTSFPST